MGLVDYLIIGIIVVIIGFAVAYVIKAKKSGKKCIGCPDGGSCSGSCSSCSSGCCSCSDKNDTSETPEK